MRQKLRQTTPLNPLLLIGPGFRGLNTEMADTIGMVDQTWALALQNVVWDTKGRIASRKGYTKLTTTAMTGTPTVRQVHEFVHDDGTTSFVAATDGKFWASSDGLSWTDVTGSLTFSAGATWKFVNFYGSVYAAAPGQKVKVYTGSGTFTEISTSPVSTGVILAAYGRLWLGVDGGSSIRYTALLNGSDWTGTDSGGIDASKAWTTGEDQPIALAAFSASFVVFGRKHILIYVDGQGSELGIDPTQMYVTDTIEGTGCIARDTVVAVGEGDLLFLSAVGMQSLVRVIQDKNNPLVDVTKNVRGLFQSYVTGEAGSADAIQAGFSPDKTMVMVLFPTAQTVVMFDTRIRLDDGTYRVAEWKSVPYHCLHVSRVTNTIYFGLAGGKIATYAGDRDDTGGANTPITMVFSSPWLDAGPEGHSRLKILKEIAVRMYGLGTLTATIRWGFDFRPLEWSASLSSVYVASGAEWNVAEWGTAEFTQGYRMRYDQVGLGGEGQFFQVYLSVVATDAASSMALQEVAVFAKLGRML